MTCREFVAYGANMKAVFESKYSNINICSQRKKKDQKERKDYGYYTLNPRKNGLDWGSISGAGNYGVNDKILNKNQKRL